MKILITGAGGFLGRNLAGSLCQQYEVFAPSRAELDLLDEDAIRQYLRQHRFDAIVHAATVRANRRIGAPPDLMQHNCRMFFNLVRNPDAFGKLLFLSSGAVYDRRGPIANIAETCFDSRVPADPYGFSKYICASAIDGMAEVFELRLFGVFGPHEDWRVRFISNACCRAVWDMPVLVRRNVFFDYLDVEDLGRIVERFLENDLQHRHYNVCTGRSQDLRTLGEKVVAASGKALDLVVRDENFGNEYSGDNSRLLEEFPDLQFRDMDDSIRRLYRWYEAHADEIDPALLRFDE
jgi:GDP-L-fucose synthase